MHILVHRLFSNTFYSFYEKNSFLVYLPFTLATIFCFGPKVIWCLKYLIGVTNSFVLTVKTSILVYTKTLSEVFRFEKYFLLAFSQYIPWSEKICKPSEQAVFAQIAQSVLLSSQAHFPPVYFFVNISHGFLL